MNNGFESILMAGNSSNIDNCSTEDVKIPTLFGAVLTCNLNEYPRVMKRLKSNESHSSQKKIKVIDTIGISVQNIYF